VFLHDDPDDRPANVFAGTTTLWSGPQCSSRLLLPVIPRTGKFAVDPPRLIPPMIRSPDKRRTHQYGAFGCSLCPRRPSALERALDLAEPDGAVFPFQLHPRPELLERHAGRAPGTAWRVRAGRWRGARSIASKRRPRCRLAGGLASRGGARVGGHAVAASSRRGPLGERRHPHRVQHVAGACRRRLDRDPSRAAARHTSRGSPDGSAAAVRSSNRPAVSAADSENGTGRFWPSRPGVDLQRCRVRPGPEPDRGGRRRTLSGSPIKAATSWSSVSCCRCAPATRCPKLAPSPAPTAPELRRPARAEHA
jgi:hypothetical protein